MVRAGVDEVHKSGTTVELGEENGGVCLRFRTLDPLQTRPDAAIITAPFTQYPAPITTHTHFYRTREEIKERDKEM